jgi:hypothetical protein
MKVKEIHFFEEAGTTHLVIKCCIPEDSDSKLADSLETDLISFPWQPVVAGPFYFSEHSWPLFHSYDVLTLLHCQDSLTECFCHRYSFFMFSRPQFQILTWMSHIVIEVFVVSTYIGSQHLLAHTCFPLCIISDRN